MHHNQRTWGSSLENSIMRINPRLVDITWTCKTMEWWSCCCTWRAKELSQESTITYDKCWRRGEQVFWCPTTFNNMGHWWKHSKLSQFCRITFWQWHRGGFLSLPRESSNFSLSYEVCISPSLGVLKHFVWNSVNFQTTRKLLSSQQNPFNLSTKARLDNIKWQH